MLLYAALTADELAAFAEWCRPGEAWGRSADHPEYARGWHVGTDEYEQARADGEQQWRDHRAGGSAGGRSFSNGNGLSESGPSVQARSDTVPLEYLITSHWWLLS